MNHRVILCRACNGRGWVWVSDPAGLDPADALPLGLSVDESRAECPDCAGVGVL